MRRFVERHGGAPVSVRMVDAGSHQLLEQRRALPFHGARHAVRTDGSEEILITIGEPPYMLEPYFLVDPTGVRVEQPQDGKLLIRIESRAGRVLTLCFSRRVGRSTGPLTLLA